MSLLLAVACSSKVTSSSNAAVAAEVYCVSTRSMPFPPTTQSSRNLKYYKYRGAKYRDSERDEVLSGLDTSSPLCIFVHGNRTNTVESVGQGLVMSERLQIAERSESLRFIVWSWPSTKIQARPVQDARRKAVRADSESAYLADFLAQLPPEQNVCLIGYSFGGRVVSGAVHQLGIHSAIAYENTGQSLCRPRVVLLAAAYPADWLTPTGRHHLTLVQAETVTSFFNPLDPALKHYELVFGPQRSYAMGYRGIALQSAATTQAVLRQYNVSDSAGRSHSLNRFVDSKSVMHMVRREAYGG